MKSIEWQSKRVAVDRIDPTPNNYKIRSDLGVERLRHSLKKFGLAGTVVLNPSNPKGYLNPATYKGRYILIDGNSRLDDAKEKKRLFVEASLPNRMLTPAEFKEMSAMFDFAKAGEVDVERIEGDLGTTKAFFGAWGLNVPLHLLSNIGKTAKVEDVEPSKLSAKKQKQVDDVKASEMKIVQLFFSERDERLFRELEVKLVKKFKSSSTMETVLKAMQKAVKV